MALTPAPGVDSGMPLTDRRADRPDRDASGCTPALEAFDARSDPLPEGETKSAVVRRMFDAIALRYDMLNRIMTFGLDMAWRRRCVSALGLPKGAVVLDLACGTGDLSRVLRHRDMRAVGADFSIGMLASNHAGAPLVQADAARLALSEASVDGAVCGFALRNFSDLAAVLAELGRVVRPGGRIALLEVSEPSSPVVRAGHAIWFTRVVPLIGGLLSDASAYAYLPRSVAYLPPWPVLASMIRRAGFSCVQRRTLGGGVAQLLLATRAGVSPPSRAAGAVVDIVQAN
jgi:demethylmenaquinone methyltransferase/2-methoxy-6-polyprenyl-1,4-benzoquinol methylase